MKVFTLALLLPVLASAGTYTPTASDVAHSGNLSSEKAQYTQADGIVHVAGAVTLGSDSTEELTKVRISLPVSSDLEAANDCHGTLGEAQYYNVGSVEANAANDAVVISLSASIADGSFSQPIHVFFSFDCEVKE